VGFWIRQRLKIAVPQNKIEQDTSKPGNAPCKLMNVSRLASLVRQDHVESEEGLRDT